MNSKFGSKKAQAAMEFLMTYGWAILAVLVAIGALAYFGVLSPSKYVPEQCLFGPGISCDDFKITSAGATFVVRNGFGKDMTVTGLNAAGCSASLSTPVLSGSQVVITLAGCSNGAAGTRFQGSLVLTYAFTESNLSKQIFGTISTKVQS